jgi:hypothetical protein
MKTLDKIMAFGFGVMALVCLWAALSTKHFEYLALVFVLGALCFVAWGDYKHFDDQNTTLRY